MFVFPAFDTNYKTRKRTFKCCRTCRTRRMKCIQSANYETVGCDNCKKSNVVCDLISTSQSEEQQSQIQKNSSTNTDAPHETSAATKRQKTGHRSGEDQHASRNRNRNVAHEGHRAEEQPQRSGVPILPRTDGIQSQLSPPAAIPPPENKYHQPHIYQPHHQVPGQSVPFPYQPSQAHGGEGRTYDRRYSMVLPGRDEHLPPPPPPSHIAPSNHQQLDPYAHPPPTSHPYIERTYPGTEGQAAVPVSQHSHYTFQQTTPSSYGGPSPTPSQVSGYISQGYVIPPPGSHHFQAPSPSFQPTPPAAGEHRAIPFPQQHFHHATAGPGARKVPSYSGVSETSSSPRPTPLQMRSPTDIVPQHVSPGFYSKVGSQPSTQPSSTNLNRFHLPPGPESQHHKAEDHYHHLEVQPSSRPLQRRPSQMYQLKFDTPSEVSGGMGPGATDNSRENTKHSPPQHKEKWPISSIKTSLSEAAQTPSNNTSDPKDDHTSNIHIHAHKKSPISNPHSRQEDNHDDDSIKQPFTASYLKEKYDFNISKPKINSPLLPSHSERLMRIRNHTPADKFNNYTQTVEPFYRIESPELTKFLVSIDAFRLGLDEKTTLELIKLYFFKINSIFPIIYEPDFWVDYRNKTVPNIVLYALVLAIARDKSAELIFYKNNIFTEDNIDSGLEHLYDRLVLKLRMIFLVLPELGDDNKMSRLICKLLMVLHYNFNKFGNEQSSHDLHESINYAKSMGIHLKVSSLSSTRKHSQEFLYNKKSLAEESEDPKKTAYVRNLWWICYIFDRLHSLVNSKETVIKDTDFSIAKPEEGSPLLELIEPVRILALALKKVFSPSAPQFDFDVHEYVRKEMQRNEEDFKSFAVFEENCVNNANKSETSSITHDAGASKLGESETPGHDGDAYFLPNVPLAAYRKNMTYLLVRIIKLVSIMAVNRRKFVVSLESKESTGINDITVVCSVNLLTYIEHFSNHEKVFNIPWIPAILGLALAVFLKHKFRGIARRSVTPPKIKYIRLMPRWNYKTLNFFSVYGDRCLRELSKWAPKWWFISEIVVGGRTLNDKLDGKVFSDDAARSSTKQEVTPKGAESLSEDGHDNGSDSGSKWSDTSASHKKHVALNSTETRDKLKIESLLSRETDVSSITTNPVTQKFLTISSPTYYVNLEDQEEEDYEGQRKEGNSVNDHEEEGKDVKLDEYENDNLLKTPEFVYDSKFAKVVSESAKNPFSLLAMSNGETDAAPSENEDYEDNPVATSGDTNPKTGSDFANLDNQNYDDNSLYNGYQNASHESRLSPNSLPRMMETIAMAYFQDDVLMTERYATME